MSRKILNLLKEMLELVETQRDALLGGRFEEAAAIQEMRQKIVDEIQDIDSRVSSLLPGINQLVGKNGPVEEDFSHQIVRTVEKILSLDREIQTSLQVETNSISERLHIIQKAKAFCYNALHHQTRGHLQISV